MSIKQSEKICCCVFLRSLHDGLLIQSFYWTIKPHNFNSKLQVQFCFHQLRVDCMHRILGFSSIFFFLKTVDFFSFNLWVFFGLLFRYFLMISNLDSLNSISLCDEIGFYLNTKWNPTNWNQLLFISWAFSLHFIAFDLNEWKKKWFTTFQSKAKPIFANLVFRAINFVHFN